MNETPQTANPAEEKLYRFLDLRERWDYYDSSVNRHTAAKVSLAGQLVVASAIGAQVTGMGIGPNYFPYISLVGNGLYEGLPEELICNTGFDHEQNFDLKFDAKDSVPRAMSLIAHGIVLSARSEVMRQASLTRWPTAEFRYPLIDCGEHFWPDIYVAYLSQAIQTHGCDLDTLSDAVSKLASEILARNWQLVVACYNAITIGEGDFQPFPMPFPLFNFWDASITPYSITLESCASIWREATSGFDAPDDDEAFLNQVFPDDGGFLSDDL